jgi:hypothetical protein
MWVGAAVLATGGFAFMASNSVAASSAGQGQAAVTGYTVSHIQYSAEQGWGLAAPTYSASTVKFILTANSTVAPANAEPAQVEVTLLSNGAPVAPTVPGQVTSWAINPITHVGTGSVVATITSPPTVASINGLDVEANQ